MLKIILFHSSSKLSRLLLTQIIMLVFGISCSGSFIEQTENTLLQPGTNSPGLQETSVQSNTSPTPEFTQIATANMENSPTATKQAEDGANSANACNAINFRICYPNDN